MKRILMSIALTVLFLTPAAFAQLNPALAKAEYQLAEQSFSKKDYRATITHLDNAEKHAGRKNQLTHYLRIMALSEFAKDNFFIIDTLTGRINNFFADPVTKKLDAVRYKEIEGVRTLFSEYDATQKLKEAKYKDLHMLTNNPLAIGTDVSALDKSIGSKKIKALLKKRTPMPMTFQDMDLIKSKADVIQVSTSVISAADASAYADITGTPIPNLFSAINVTDHGVLLNEKTKVVSIVYLVSSKDNTDLLTAVMKDFGRPYLTQIGADGTARIWKFGSMFMVYAPIDGEEALMTYRVDALK